MNATARIHQSSGRVDFGTPPEYTDAARVTFGEEIGLDVASAPYWNKYVKARRYWHISNVSNRWWQPQRVHPLERNWTNYDGSPTTVWMNHPYGRKANVAWVHKAIYEYFVGNVTQMCILTWAEQSTEWGRMLRAYPRFIPHRRLAHMGRDGKPLRGGVKGSMVTYLGPNVYKFAIAFPVLCGGTVDIPAHNMSAMMKELEALEKDDE